MAQPIPADPVLAARVRQLADLDSIAGAARKLGLAEATVARLAGGLRVTQGTALLATERLRILNEAVNVR
jgi:hypothetical protein